MTSEDSLKGPQNRLCQVNGVKKVKNWYWHRAKSFWLLLAWVIMTNIVVFICASIAFNFFRVAKSAFLRSLFLDWFQLVLQILGGYEKCNLWDMVLEFMGEVTWPMPILSLMPFEFWMFESPWRLLDIFVSFCLLWKLTKQLSQTTVPFHDGLTLSFVCFQVMYEDMRYVTSTPYLMPHVATKDGELAGYLVPKGAQVRPVQADWKNTVRSRKNMNVCKLGHLLGPNAADVGFAGIQEKNTNFCGGNRKWHIHFAEWCWADGSWIIDF